MAKFGFLEAIMAKIMDKKENLKAPVVLNDLFPVRVEKSPLKHKKRIYKLLPVAIVRKLDDRLVTCMKTWKCKRFRLKTGRSLYTSDQKFVGRIESTESKKLMFLADPMPDSLDRGIGIYIRIRIKMEKL